MCETTVLYLNSARDSSILLDSLRGETGAFTSSRAGKGSLNLAKPMRVMFYVDDVDAMYAHVLARGFMPETPSRDAKWGERYFHLTTLTATPFRSRDPYRVPTDDQIRLSWRERVVVYGRAPPAPAASAPPPSAELAGTDASGGYR